MRPHSIATVVHRNEKDLFRKWGAREIQLIAQDEGRIVWIKKFGFVPIQKDVMDNDYREWRKTSSTGPVDPPADPKDFPDEFLLTRPSIHAYMKL